MKFFNRPSVEALPFEGLGMAVIGRRIAKRSSVDVWGVYRTPNGGTRDVQILDLSESGCRFFDKFSGLAPNQQINLKIGELSSFRVTVRWSDGGYVGAEFERPLYGPIFDHIRELLSGREIDRRLAGRTYRST
jgi:hypothetical protein